MCMVKCSHSKLSILNMKSTSVLKDTGQLFNDLEHRECDFLLVVCCLYRDVCVGQDPTNLQTKLQKHQNFEAEVEANRSRIESIRVAGNELIESDHYAKDIIRSVVLPVMDQGLIK